MSQNRRCHQEISAHRLPIGSGVTEIGIRIVANLNVSELCLYWLEKTAEAMLMLSSYYKAGLWNLLKNSSSSLTFLIVG